MGANIRSTTEISVGTIFQQLAEKRNPKNVGEEVLKYGVSGYNASLALTITALFVGIVTQSLLWLGAAAVFYTIKNLCKDYIIERIVQKACESSGNIQKRDTILCLLEKVQGASLSSLSKLFEEFRFSGHGFAACDFFGIVFLNPLGDGVPRNENNDDASCDFVNRCRTFVGYKSSSSSPPRVAPIRTGTIFSPCIERGIPRSQRGFRGLLQVPSSTMKGEVRPKSAPPTPPSQTHSGGTGSETPPPLPPRKPQKQRSS